MAATTSKYYGHPQSAVAATSDWLDEEDRLLRAVEVQAQLGLSRAKVYRLMQQSVLPTVRIGGSVRVPRKALARWIEENIRPGQKIAV
jgi:excisionase family DNA binding protein